MPERPDVVDIAAGTGKLTRTLARLAGTLVAVEPDAALRAVLQRELPDVTALEGTAEDAAAGDGERRRRVRRPGVPLVRPRPRARRDRTRAAPAGHRDRGLELPARGRHLVRRRDRLPRRPRTPTTCRPPRGTGRRPSAGIARFGGLLEIAARHEQPIDRESFRRLLGTHSALNALTPDRRAELIEQALAVAERRGAFDADGRGAIPWRCELFVLRRT